MQCALDLAVGVGTARERLRVIGAVDGLDIAFGVVVHFDTFYNVCTLEAHLLVGGETEELLGRVLHEVVALDPQLLAEGHGVLAGGGVLGVVGHVESLLLALGVVVDDQADGVDDGADAGGDAVEVVAHGMLEELDVVEGLVLGVADAADEVLDGVWGVAASAQAADGGHAGVVPAGHQALLDELEQLALAHDRVGEVEAVELDLARTVALVGQEADKVVVEGTVRHELQRADAVGDALEVVALAVGEVVHGIYVPGGAGAPVGRVDDAVHDGVAEVHVVAGHVDLGTQHVASLLELALVHALEQVEVLLHGSVAVGALDARRGGGALLCGYLLAGLLVDVGVTALDEADCQVVELGEVVGGVV